MNKGNKKLIILGAGNFAEEVLDIAKESGYFVTCFVEGIDPERCEMKIAGIPVIWIGNLKNYDHSHGLLCGVGSPKRKNMFDQYSSNIIFTGSGKKVSIDQMIEDPEKNKNGTAVSQCNLKYFQPRKLLLWT